MTPVSNLVAIPGPTKIRADDLLGFLTMSTVPDLFVEYDEVVREWAREGLDTKVMPKPGAPVDIFQLACAAVATRRVRGASEVILAERAHLSKDECVYQITRSVRDSANKVIEHPKAMSVTFTTATEHISVFQREDYDELRALDRQIRSNYRAFKTQIPGSKVRTGVRETIVRLLGGTNYMGKGIYLIPRSGLNTMESIQRILDALYGNDAHLSLIPMLNTKANRDDLSRFHADDIRDRSEKLMATIADKLSAGGTVRSDMLGNVRDEFVALQAQRDAILAMVGKETSSVDARLTVIEQQYEALVALAARKEAVTA